jgi:hypothetical protein
MAHEGCYLELSADLLGERFDRIVVEAAGGRLGVAFTVLKEPVQNDDNWAGRLDGGLIEY